jgi:hypothetical protein
MLVLHPGESFSPAALFVFQTAPARARFISSKLFHMFFISRSEKRAPRNWLGSLRPGNSVSGQNLPAHEAMITLVRHLNQGSKSGEPGHAAAWSISNSPLPSGSFFRANSFEDFWWEAQRFPQ